MFDYLKQAMSLMPDKNWNSESKSWCLYFPKKDEAAKALMQMLDLKPSKALSGTSNFYVVPVEDPSPQGFFSVDSFASMATRETEEKDDSGKVRSALEASEFSTQLKRVKIDLAEKKIVMLGTNQLRSHVRQQYGGPDDQQYEPGGNALKFYSEARCRTYSRSGGAGKPFGPWFEQDKASSKFGIEKSVESNGTDRYAYKEVKNTKNKFGKPGLKAMIRVWVSDAKGNPRGVDPVFDLYNYLRSTNQIVFQKTKGEGGKGLKFNLLPSIGAARADLLNSLKPFDFLALKMLVLGEYTNDVELYKRGAAKMGLSKKVSLRESLFKQIRTDESVYSTIKAENLIKDEEYEDDDAGPDYESEEL